MPLFGKVYLNGPLQSPLFKILKKGSDYYDKRGLGSHKIKDDFNIFLVKGNLIKHYNPNRDFKLM